MFTVTDGKKRNMARRQLMSLAKGSILKQKRMYIESLIQKIKKEVSAEALVPYTYKGVLYNPGAVVETAFDISKNQNFAVTPRAITEETPAYALKVSLANSIDEYRELDSIIETLLSSLIAKASRVPVELLPELTGKSIFAALVPKIDYFNRYVESTTWKIIKVDANNIKSEVALFQKAHSNHLTQIKKCLAGNLLA